MTDIIKRLPSVVGNPLHGIIRFMELCVALCGFIMALTFFAVVIIRYGFSGNLFAYEEWLLAISFWGFFFGAALASKRKTHVNADILGVVLKNPKVIWWRANLIYLVEIAIGVYIVYWCYLSVESEFIAYPLWETTPALKIPAVISRIAILTGFLFMTIFNIIHFALHLIDGPSFDDTQS